MRSLRWLMAYVSFPRLGILALLVLATAGLSSPFVEAGLFLVVVGLLLLSGSILFHANTLRKEAKVSPQGTPVVPDLPPSGESTPAYDWGVAFDLGDACLR
jgi:uncharacterized membrane protein YgdD (TMEM256/DUF423 family)